MCSVGGGDGRPRADGRAATPLAGAPALEASVPLITLPPTADRTPGTRPRPGPPLSVGTAASSRPVDEENTTEPRPGRGLDVETHTTGGPTARPITTPENPTMKIYTGRGDEGQTDLRDMSRVSKASPRIEAYGNVDEVNSLVGRVRPTGYDDVDEWLREVQNHLHIVQADFANPDPDEDDPVLKEEHTAQVEEWIDTVEEELEPLTSFILPGGGDAGARLHHARAVCRRAERRAVVLMQDEPVNREAVVYLNRLSDLLFVLARLVNAREDVPEESPTY